MTQGGAVRERTRLAWRRTSLALTVVAMLTIRLAVRHGLDPLGTLAAAAALLGWVSLLAVIQIRLQAVSAHLVSGAGRALTTLMMGCLGYGLLGLVLTLS